MSDTLCNENRRSVAIFNQYKRCIGVCRSVNATASLLGVTPAQITLACKGDTITCKKYYTRYWSNEVVSYSELQNMSLLMYDDICELKNFRYYATGKISRKGMKYKKG